MGLRACACVYCVYECVGEYVCMHFIQFDYFLGHSPGDIKTKVIFSCDDKLMIVL